MGEGKRDPPSKFPSLHGPLATGFSCISMVPGNRHDMWKQQRSMGRISALSSSVIPGEPNFPSSKITARGWLFLTPPTTSTSPASVPSPPLGPCPCARPSPHKSSPCKNKGSQTHSQHSASQQATYLNCTKSFRRWGQAHLPFT